MTTIAYDGKTLAADRMAQNVNGVFVASVCKVLRAKTGDVVSWCGNHAWRDRLLTWVNGGMLYEAPKGEYSALVVHPDGKCWRVEGDNGGWFEVDAPYADGSGMEFALAAMACGKTAAEAVEIACRFDTASGGGVDSVEIIAAEEGST